jgi:hypothetical protein
MAEPDIANALVSGDGVMCRIFVGNDRFGQDLMVSGSIKPRTTQYQDDHMGNDVSKLDMRIWGWDLSLKFKYKTDRMIRALLAFYASKALPGAKILPMSILLAIQEMDSSAKRPGYLFAPCIADYNLELPGMKERLMQGLDAKAERWKPTQVST